MAAKWTRQRVMEAVRAWHQRGLPLTDVWRKDLGLYNAAKRLFGTWRRALADSGLSHHGRTRRKKWTRQRVVEAIWARRDRGLSLTAAWKEDPRLYRAARSRFGSWAHALLAAGVVTNGHKTWSRQQVLVAIRLWRQEATPATATDGVDPSLRAAAVRHFGSWPAAVAAAGPTQKLYRRWTKQRVLDAIRNWVQRGLPVAGLCREDPGLYRAAGKHFGSWHDALTAAGIPSKRRRSWSKEGVIHALQVRRFVSVTDLAKQDRSLVEAAKRYFGGVLNAQRAAGLKPKPRKWFGPRIIRAIQDEYIQGVPITDIKRGDQRFLSAARRYFGSWRNALVAAGLLRKEEAPTPRIKWSRQRVIEAIGAWDQESSKTRPKDRRLIAAAKRHFGGWHKALAASRTRRHGAGRSPERRQRTR